MKIKPKCNSCSRIYLDGRDGQCETCLSGKIHKRKVKPLRCLCGKPAVVVLLATVLTPEEAPLELEIPLCRGCRDLERAMEREPAALDGVFVTNPAQIVVLKSLPRIKPALKGKFL